jgi:hypothetical protein
MRIKMLTLMAGPDEVRKPGQIVDVPDKEAKSLVDGGYAVAVKATEEARRAERTTRGKRGETATDPKVEDAEE